MACSTQIKNVKLAVGGGGGGMKKIHFNIDKMQ